MNLFDLIFTAFTIIPVLGQSNPEIIIGHIVGGTEVDIEAYPYQVSVRFNDEHICGGSILDKTTVLTAAHCVDGTDHKEFGVRVGNTAHAKGKFIKVSQVRQHENFDPVTIDNDMAILKLARPLRFTNKIQPIALQPKGKKVPTGTTAWVSGWGVTFHGSRIIQENLRAVDVAIMNDAKCSNLYQEGWITSNMMCARKLKHDACQSDSGGPLVADRKLIGVVSWGYGCADFRYPGVYAKVSAMYDWIIANK